MLWFVLIIGLVMSLFAVMSFLISIREIELSPYSAISSIPLYYYQMIAWLLAMMAFISFIKAASLV